MKTSIKDSINKTKEFIELWVKFHQIYKEAMEKSSISRDEEEAFLQTKSIIARKFQALADSLSVDRVTADRTYDVINSILSLKSISTLSEPTLKKLESDWHEAYISLNRLVGHLEAQRHSRPQEESQAKKRVASFVKTVFYFLIAVVFVLFILYISYILFGAIKQS